MGMRSIRQLAPEWASANLTDGGPASVTYQIGANIKF